MWASTCNTNQAVCDNGHSQDDPTKTILYNLGGPENLTCAFSFYWRHLQRNFSFGFIFFLSVVKIKWHTEDNLTEIA